MTPHQKKLARHALGLTNPDANGCSYRNYYVCGSRGAPYSAWMRMVKNGEAIRSRFGAHTSNRFSFHLTSAGAQAALETGESLDPEDFPSLKRTG